MKRLLCAALLIGAAAAWTATRPDDEIPFAKHTIDLGQNEPAVFTDVNHDGHIDIVSGENWYEGPKWTRHHFRDILFTNNYIDDFSDLPIDVNGDGYPDIVSCGWFSKSLWWDENPGPNTGAPWKRHEIQGGFNIEFCFAVDLDNDGKAQEVLPEFGNVNAPLSFYELKNGVFERHIVSDKSYGHGIGAGDVNKDGKTDILTPKGWFEAPGWKFHPDWDLGQTGFIYVHDVNGDGRPDLITSLAHDYGIFWMEQTAAGTWKKHVIDESWSQSHAMTLVDLNKDGRPDLLTGKRYSAHNGHDPGGREPLGVYWYEYLPPDEKGNVEWVKHVIDYGARTGGGMQIPAADIDGDGDLDFAVGGKSGLFLFENKTR
ncbi:MAG: VCBS repeat-containing protein [Acidobacteriota bacterium]|nr:VCBS repeat-containing protein [Acidobacteriota bacterium]